MHVVWGAAVVSKIYLWCGNQPAIHTPKSRGTYPTFPNQRFKIIAFTDPRDNKAEIARNVENSEPKLVTTKDDVSKWCTDRFRELLQQYAFDSRENGETVQLRGEVVQFYVLEDNLYRGAVGWKITAEAPDKSMLWQGLVTGTSQRFGRSYSEENYYETLSDAYIEAVQNLVKDEGFAKALRAGN